MSNNGRNSRYRANTTVSVLKKSKLVKMSVINYNLRNELIAFSNSLTYCYQCSTCSGACPVALLTSGKYNPRKIILEANLGLENKLMDAQDSHAWDCSTCQKCVELCPQKVGLTDIFVRIKNMCYSKGLAPEAFLLQASAVFENGVAIPYSRPIIQRREKLGLPEIKTAEIQEIKTLLKNIHFDSPLSKKVINP